VGGKMGKMGEKIGGSKLLDMYARFHGISQISRV
jgi:hypothetical protein